MPSVRQLLEGMWQLGEIGRYNTTLRLCVHSLQILMNWWLLFLCLCSLLMVKDVVDLKSICGITCWRGRNLSESLRGGVHLKKEKDCMKDGIGSDFMIIVESEKCWSILTSRIRLMLWEVWVQGRVSSISRKEFKVCISNIVNNWASAQPNASIKSSMVGKRVSQPIVASI